MRKTPGFGARSGPFLLQARLLLAFSGTVAIAMGLIHLFDELQRTEVGVVYAVLAVIASQVWLFGLFFAWQGNRLALAIVGLLAFAEFGAQASTHFALGVNAIEFLVPSRGIGFVVNLLLLQVACIVSCVAAIVCASNPRGVSRRYGSFPFLLLALAGSSALLLHAADDIGRRGFGALSVEDGLMVAVVTTSTWIVGSLWMAGAPRLAALLVAVASANVVIPFVTLHLAKGGVSLETIARESGAGAAALAAALAVLAGASLIGSLVWLTTRLLPAVQQYLTARKKRRAAEARTNTTQ